jgi:hypothetical protein
MAPFCRFAGAEEQPAPSPSEAQAPPCPAAEETPSPCIIPAAPSAYQSAPKKSLTTWVAKVNGDPISLALFARRLAANRASAYVHFGDRCGPSPGEGLWTTEYDGETPAHWLKQRTLEECVRIQVELGLGKRHDLLPDTSYAAFLMALDRENERRRAALARAEPIYGPQQYREDEFLLYVMNNLRLALQSHLADSELRSSEEARRDFYESVKDKYFNRGDRVKVWVIAVTPGKRNEHGESYTDEEARARMLEAKRRLDGGAGFEEVAAEYSDGGGYREQVFDPEGRSDPRMHGAEMREQARKLSEGEVSGVFQEMHASGAGPCPSGDTAYCIIKCMSRESLGYHPFEEVEEAVTRIYLRQQYERLVDRLVKSATIEINQPELDRVEVR